MKYCAWLHDINLGKKEDTHLPESSLSQWGEEATLLARVQASGVLVVPSFTLSTSAYAAFFGVDRLQRSIEKLCSQSNIQKDEAVAKAAHSIRQAILKASWPEEVKKEVAAYYTQLREQLLCPPHAALPLDVRYAEQRIGLEVSSVNDLCKAVQQLYALGFTPQALHQRLQSSNVILPAAIPLLIQYSSPPEVTGSAVCFDPEQHDDSTIFIQSYYHHRPLHHTVQGVDEYRVDRKSLLLLSRTLNRQWWRQDSQGKHTSPPEAKQGVPALNDSQITRLARKIKRAQDISLDTLRFGWALRDGRLEILEIKKWEEPTSPPLQDSNRPSPLRPLLYGQSGWLGQANGPVKRVCSKKDQAQVKDGDVVVVQQLIAEDAAWLDGCAALIVETAGYSPLDSRLLNRLGVPAVVGTGTALAQLKDGQWVTVDGTQGVVYAGRVNSSSLSSVGQQPSNRYVTGTKLYAALTDLQQVNAGTLAGFDGIGLLRSEYILQLLRIHPREIIQRQLSTEYAEILAEQVEESTRLLYPKPVIYQFHDLYSAQITGQLSFRHELSHEPNPKLGYRGAHRLLKEPDIWELELAALEQLVEKGFHNLAVMIPMLRKLDEIAVLIARLHQLPFFTDHPLDIWVKCETPATAILIEELATYPIAGICFDTAALSQLVTGIDQDSSMMGHHLQQADLAVTHLLSQAIRVARQQHLATTIVSEGISLQPEYIEAAVHAGVTGVCVAPTEAAATLELLASIEQRMLLDHLIEEVPAV